MDSIIGTPIFSRSRGMGMSSILLYCPVFAVINRKLLDGATVQKRFYVLKCY